MKDAFCECSRWIFSFPFAIMKYCMIILAVHC